MLEEIDKKKNVTFCNRCNHGMYTAREGIREKRLERDLNVKCWGALAFVFKYANYFSPKASGTAVCHRVTCWYSTARAIASSSIPL